MINISRDFRVGGSLRNSIRHLTLPNSAGETVAGFVVVSEVLREKLSLFVHLAFPLNIVAADEIAQCH